MIQITDKDSAPHLAPGFDFVISILDPRLHWDHNFGPNHIVVRMEDAERPTALEGSRQKKGVHQILNWVKEKGITPEHRVLVHCHAGVSRSAAIAWLILIMQGGDPVEVFKNLYKARPIIWPNSNIMAIGANYLKRIDIMSVVRDIHGEISERRGGFLGY